jgi:hypothetical protein
VVSDQREIELDLHADAVLSEPRTVAGRVVSKDKPEVGVDQANLIGKFVGYENVRESEGTSDAMGNFHLSRNGVSDFYLLAIAPDGMRGMVLVGDSDTPVTIEVGATASLSGRIVDEQGEPFAGATLRYGIQHGEMRRSWYPRFDDETKTDQRGSFTAGLLVPGHAYWLMVAIKVDGSGRPKALELLGHFKPEVPGTIELGELKLSRAHS